MTSPLTDPWLLVVKLRRTLVRRSTRRLLVAAVAVGTGLTVTSLVREAEEAQGRWGDTRHVVVALRDLQPGEVVDPDMVTVRELPEAAVAGTALTDIPAGVVVNQPVAAGEPLVSDRLAPEGLQGVAALVPEGYRAISIPVGPSAMPPVRIGDHVDVLGVVPPSGHGGEELGAELPFPVVERASVVDVGDQTVTIAVPAVDAPLVAATLTHGVAILTLAGA